MKNIAFVYTEYQQNILFSVCEQKNIEIDILFVRKGILIHKNMNNYVHKVIYYEDISFSWRSVRKYYREYMKTIDPHIDSSSEYRIFTWSLVNPISRYAINLTQCKHIDLIEDGSGSYVKWGYNNYNLGFKTFTVSTFIFLMTNIFSRSMIPLNLSCVSGWSLFDGCYPDFDVDKKLIEHEYFQKVIGDSLDDKNEELCIGSNSVIFITSPYVEFGILSEKEFVQIMIESVEKIKDHQKRDLDTIYLKPHPRTNIEDEKKRLHRIEEITNIHFKILYTDSNIELLALENSEKMLRYYSLGSSSLYVIKVLVPRETTVCLVENEDLNSKIATQSGLNKLYRLIGIEII